MAHGDRDLGDLILQPTSIGGDFDGVQYASFVDSMCDISDGNNKPEDKLIWPLMSSLRGSSAANIASGDDGTQENAEYETDNVVGRDSKDGCVFMSSKCFLDLGEDGPLANSFYVFRHTTEKNVVPHTKLYMRLYKHTGNSDGRLRWIKMGSDCLSIGAQGLYDHKERSVTMRNWEMSILFHEQTCYCLPVRSQSYTKGTVKFGKCISQCLLSALTLRRIGRRMGHGRRTTSRICMNTTKENYTLGHVKVTTAITMA